MPRIGESVRLKPSQVDILRVLSVANGPLSRLKIADRTGLATCTLCPALGSLDAEARGNALKRTGFKSLMLLGYVEAKTFDIDGLKEIAYSMTEKGEEVLALLSSQD